MINPKNLTTAVATIVVVAGIGYAMQNGGANAKRNSANEGHSANQSNVRAQPNLVEIAEFLPVLPSALNRSFGLATPEISGAIRVAAVTSAIDTNLQNDAPTPMFLPSTCDVELNAMPQTGAMVRLELDAPCYQNQRILVRHAGLEFADITKADGRFGVSVPALNAFAPFIMVFADGTEASAKTLKLSLDGYERVAVSWAGQAVLHVHAMEFGAKFGEAGHTWAQTPQLNEGSPGGTLIQLGNPNVMSPKLAEVYSVNMGEIAHGGTIELMVEAEINVDTCARQISGNSFQLLGDGSLNSTSISISLPECGGENGYLLLNNLFSDMKIAAN